MRTGNVDENAGRAVDGRLKQRAGDGGLRSLLGLVAAGGGADAHVGLARVAHDGGNVGKVEVDDDILAVADELGDGADGLLQNIIRNAECVGEGDLLVGDEFQAVVRDNDHGIDLIGEVGNAGLSLLHAVRALEAEGLRHDGDGQNACVMRDLRDNGCSAGAGAAAHTGGDEDHVGALEHLRNERLGFFGRFLANIRLGACAHAAGQLFADLHLILALGLFKVLLIRVDRNKLDALDVGRDHAVDNVIAGSADANDFDLDYLICCICHLSSSCISHSPQLHRLRLCRLYSISKKGVRQ